MYYRFFTFKSSRATNNWNLSYRRSRASPTPRSNFRISPRRCRKKKQQRRNSNNASFEKQMNDTSVAGWLAGLPNRKWITTRGLSSRDLDKRCVTVFWFENIRAFPLERDRVRSFFFYTTAQQRMARPCYVFLTEICRTDVTSRYGVAGSEELGNVVEVCVFFFYQKPQRISLFHRYCFGEMRNYVIWNLHKYLNRLRWKNFYNVLTVWKHLKVIKAICWCTKDKQLLCDFL